MYIAPDPSPASPPTREAARLEAELEDSYYYYTSNIIATINIYIVARIATINIHVVAIKIDVDRSYYTNILLILI